LGSSTGDFSYKRLLNATNGAPPIYVKALDFRAFADLFEA
jgi:hypothetical protein